MYKFLTDCKEYRSALVGQFVVNIKTTIASTRLGPVWWILDPLVLMCIYTFVIKFVFNRGGADYHIFALCGIVTWQTFARSVNICSRSLKSNAALIRQAALPMELYVVIPPIVQSFFYLIGLFIIGLWNSDMLGLHTLSAVLIIIPMVLIPFGLGLFLAISEVYIPDTGKFLPYLLRIGFYMSPILYSPERVYSLESIPQCVKYVYSLNPMVHLISGVRNIFLNGKMFDILNYCIILVASIFLVQLGLYFFRKKSVEVPKLL